MWTHGALDAAKNSVAVVLSPHAAALEDDRSPRVLLQQLGLHVAEQLGVADLAGDTHVGKRWRRRHYQSVIAAGGDGTIGTTISHLAGTGIPLGILPMGTSNDVARALDIPLDPAAAAAVIVNGIPIEVDSGLVLETNSDTRLLNIPTRRRLMERWLPQRLLKRWGRDTPSSLYFLHAATLGLNAEFAHLATDADRRAALGGLTYPVSSLEALTHLRSIPIRLQLAGVLTRNTATEQRLQGTKSAWEISLATEVLQLTVVNTPLFGGSLNLRLPGADAHDHLLDIFLVESPRLDKGLETARAIVERLHAARDLLGSPGSYPSLHEEREEQRPDDLRGDMLFPGIRRYQAHAVSIQTVEPVQMTLDGELCAQTPVQIEVQPSALTVLVPRPATSYLAGQVAEV